MYPDVNKLWDGNDDLLCWAAAASNALFYTGWADQYNSAEEVFTLFRNSFDDKPGSVYQGIRFFLRVVLQSDSSLQDYIKTYPSSGLPNIEQIKGAKKCGIVGLKNDRIEYTHNVACYDFTEDSSIAEKNDPRRITHLIYSDSDDRELANKTMTIKYNINTKRYDLLDEPLKGYYIYYVAILCPPDD